MATEQVQTAVGEARGAFPAWRDTPLRKRLAVIAAFRKRLARAISSLEEAVAADVGKPRLDVVTEVFHICNYVGWLKANAGEILGDRSIPTFPLLHKSAEVRYRPFGVVAAITPFNYPVILTLSPVLQALAAGNAVVLKPSEHLVRTAPLLRGLWTEAGGPEGAWRMVEGGADVAAALAAAEVDKIAFTGGAAGGRAVLRAAAERLVPVVLELGGSDAMVVAADADLDRAAACAVWGSFLNAGQSCVAVRRVFVERPAHDRLLAAIADQARRLTQGPPGSGPHSGKWDNDLGLVRTDRQAAQWAELIADAVALGGKVAAGGPPGDGRKLPPTVLAETPPQARVWSEEVFSPLLAVAATDTLEEAADRADAHSLGLGASVWTSSRRTAERLIGRLDVGGVAVNDALIQFAVPGLPFGGAKQSGFGRSQGAEGLREFVRTQAVVRHRFGGPELHWFPYRDRHAWLARLVRWWYG